ncbi:MAG: 4'-phosphopantetheinyl transferase family protein [Flavobacterium sp.]
MIGNDVVDIAAARKESNIWRKGWQEKLFTVGEQTYISQSSDAERAVWLLWSMKEAAYKAWNRQTGIRAFIPQKLECVIEQCSATDASGTVKIQGFSYVSKSFFLAGVIHTIVAESLKDLNLVREVAVGSLTKDSRLLPCIIKGDTCLPASKSHHGKSVKAIAGCNNI